MPTYTLKFDLIKKTGEREGELIEKQETVIGRNMAFAKVYIIKKYVKGQIKKIHFKETECVIDHSNIEGAIH